MDLWFPYRPNGSTPPAAAFTAASPAQSGQTSISQPPPAATFNTVTPQHSNVPPTNRPVNIKTASAVAGPSSANGVPMTTMRPVPSAGAPMNGSQQVSAVAGPSASQQPHPSSQQQQLPPQHQHRPSISQIVTTTDRRQSENTTTRQIQPAILPKDQIDRTQRRICECEPILTVRQISSNSFEFYHAQVTTSTSTPETH
jgi:hypothetical protein